MYRCWGSRAEDPETFTVWWSGWRCLVTGAVLCPAHTTGELHVPGRVGRPQSCGGPCELGPEGQAESEGGALPGQGWASSTDGWQCGGLACGRHSGDEAEGAGRPEKRAQKATLS